MHWSRFVNNVWNFEVQNLNRLPLYTAAKLAIESIIDSYPSPYNLMVSGGVDSQAMLYLWNKFGKNFKPISIVYNTDYNLFDILDKKVIKYQHDFDIEYMNFDILSFFKGEVHEYAIEYKCSSPCINAHIKMSENIEGTVIFSGDFIGNTNLPLSNAILGLYRASLTRKNLIPFFFLHTPELAYSLQHHIDIQKILEDKKNIQVYNRKTLLYTRNGLLVIPQPSKGTGFEKIKDYYDENFSDLVPKIDRIRFATRHSKRTFDLLLRYPYELKFDTEPFLFKINTFG